jgi:RNA polymerase sigma-70 factor (ECF subfamily)
MANCFHEAEAFLEECKPMVREIAKRVKSVASTVPASGFNWSKDVVFQHNSINMLRIKPSVSPAPNHRGNQEMAVTNQRAAKPGYVQVDWRLLVERVMAGEDSAMEQLYRLFSRGIRYYLYRHLGPQDLEDKVHDTFLIVVNAIRRGDVREPERLMGFVRTVAQRQVAGCIERNVHDRKHEVDFVMAGAVVADTQKNPEQEAMLEQKAELMKIILAQLSSRDREILVRFYLHEQTQEQICREMRLTETQFRLTKSRAKAKFGNLGKKRLSSNDLLSGIAKANAA